jgi:uncharacterized membrane protein
MTIKNLNLKAFFVLTMMVLPCILFATEPEQISVHSKDSDEIPFKHIFEILETCADVIGIAIILIGFLRGLYMFIRLEIDRILGKKDYEELFSLRNILGTYIIISLDFLIVSDIIHSVISPELNELLGLGIIVVLRTSIGYFLGKELHELRKELKTEEAEDDAKKKH